MLNSEETYQRELTDILQRGDPRYPSGSSVIKPKGVKGLLQEYRSGRPSETGLASEPSLIAWVIEEKVGARYHPVPVRKGGPVRSSFCCAPLRQLACYLAS